MAILTDTYTLRYTIMFKLWKDIVRFLLDVQNTTENIVRFFLDVQNTTENIVRFLLDVQNTTEITW